MTMTRTKAEFRALTISTNDGKAEMNERGRYNYRYVVTVSSDATGAKIRFIFHGSEDDYSKGKAGMGPDELLWAFRCFVSDAEAGSVSFDEFCDEFGYGHDSIAARDIHTACKRARAKFDRLHYVATDPADVLEALSAEGVE